MPTANSVALLTATKYIYMVVVAPERAANQVQEEDGGEPCLSIPAHGSAAHASANAMHPPGHNTTEAEPEPELVLRMQRVHLATERTMITGPPAKQEEAQQATPAVQSSQAPATQQPALLPLPLLAHDEPTPALPKPSKARVAAQLHPLWARFADDHAIPPPWEASGSAGCGGVAAAPPAAAGPEPLPLPRIRLLSFDLETTGMTSSDLSIRITDVALVRCRGQRQRCGRGTGTTLVCS